jgi:hypothetical protein
MSAVLKEAADALELSQTPPVSAAPPVPVFCVDSDDGIPGLRCIGFGCEA